MADANAKQPIIIKKIKKGGHGHHGGAWKVAYADFVTAMMAFFLLMWLLNATEAEQLAGLADYFAPTVGISGEMGIGFRGGKAAISDGIGADLNTNKGIVYGGVPAGPIIKVTEKKEIQTQIADDEKVVITVGTPGEGGAKKNLTKEEAEKTLNAIDKQKFSKAEDEMKSFVESESNNTGLKEVLDITQTVEGLEIQIKDSSKDSMFKGDTHEFTDRIKKVLEKISDVIQSLPNYVRITGHVASQPVSRDGGKYTNWELSTDRANATRRFLLERGIQADRIHEVVGKADNEPLDPKRPDMPLNNRISILLLKNALLPHHKQVAPEGVFLNPDSDKAKELLDKKEPAPEKPQVNPEMQKLLNDSANDSLKKDNGLQNIENPSENQ